jgi:hypothetical protein
MMRRTALGKIGLFDPSIRGTADWDMFIRAAAAGPILSDTRVMTLYRQHELQWSRQQLTLRIGSVSTMEKTASWVLHQRPDLTTLVRKAWARRLRELARAQLDSDQERGLALGTLRRLASRLGILTIRAG